MESFLFQKKKNNKSNGFREKVVPLRRVSKVLSLDNEKKKSFSFCIVLAYSYLCSRETDDDTSDRTCGVAIGYGTGTG